MALAEQWSVARSAGTCRRCEAEFPEGALFFSALSEGDDGFVRRDFCPDCWETGDPGAFFCFWRTRRPVAESKPVVNTDLMLDFFDRLAHADSEEKRAFRFVIALSLMRRKELKLVEVARRQEGESLVLQKRSTGENVEVRNPELTEDQIQAAAAQLAQLFDANL